MNIYMSNRRFPWIPAIILLVFIAGVLISGRIYYVRQMKAFKKARQQDLAVIAVLKAGQLTNWLEHCRKDALVVQNSSMDAQLVRRYQQNPSSPEEMHLWLNELRSDFGYSSAVLLDTTGAIIFSDGADRIGPDQRTSLK